MAPRVRAAIDYLLAAFAQDEALHVPPSALNDYALQRETPPARRSKFWPVASLINGRRVTNESSGDRHEAGLDQHPYLARRTALNAQGFVSTILC